MLHVGGRAGNVRLNLYNCTALGSLKGRVGGNHAEIQETSQAGHRVFPDTELESLA